MARDIRLDNLARLIEKKKTVQVIRLLVLKPHFNKILLIRNTSLRLKWKYKHPQKRLNVEDVIILKQGAETPVGKEVDEI